jgi:23S rRNA G2445 N2-methylase RlmL
MERGGVMAAEPMAWVRREQLAENITLYQGDCRAVLPTLGKVDAVVTDPPYGIRADENPIRSIKRYGDSQWDRDRPSPEVFDLIKKTGREQIIWGGQLLCRPSAALDALAGLGQGAAQLFAG